MRPSHGQVGRLAVVGLCALCAAVASGMDTAFSYQGRLDISGMPANGEFDFRFILYDSEIGGSQVGPILYGDDIPVSNGLFTVHLDFGSGVFSGSDRWLEVAVRPGTETGLHTMLSPRQAILPSPYSLHAGKVSWADIVDIPSGYADDADANPSNELQTLSLDGSTLSLSLSGGSVELPTGSVTAYTDVPSTGFGTTTTEDIAQVSFTLDDQATVLILADVNVWGVGPCEDTLRLTIDGNPENRTAVHVDNQAAVGGNNGLSVATSWMQTFAAGSHTVQLRAWGGCSFYMHPHLHALVLGD